jgi:ribosomal protein L11 methyltransferase
MPQLFRLVVLAPRPLMDHLDLAFEGEALGTAMFVVEERVGLWRFEAWFDGMPNADGIQVRIAAAEAGAGMRIGDWQCAPVPDIDWVGEAQKSFVPIRAGRFFLHASTWEGTPPPGSLSLIIDAATAFGTGEHATTQGCLIAITRLLKRTRPRRAFDLGCGTGVLGMALAKAGVGASGSKVLMSDIDARAVQVAQANAERNGVAARVEAVTATGLAHPRIAAGAPYNLVVANILARPLVAMATGLSRMVAPDGHVVLSGLIDSQERWVRAAYRARGFAFVQAIRRQGWITLVLRNGA